MELPEALGICVGAIALMLFIYAGLLKISTRIATGSPLEWGAALWTSVCIIAAQIVAGILLSLVQIDNPFVTGILAFLITVWVISSMLSLTFVQSLIVAAILNLLMIILRFILGAIGLFAASSAAAGA